MARFLTHFCYSLPGAAGEARYLVAAETQDTDPVTWKVTLQSACPQVAYAETFSASCNSADEALQKGLDILDQRHPGGAKVEEDLHIGLRPDGSLSGAPFDVLAAMEEFVTKEGPDAARRQIAADASHWIVALCSGTKKALAVCDYCIRKLASAQGEATVPAPGTPGSVIPPPAAAEEPSRTPPPAD